jgi:hypothetical protein
MNFDNSVTEGASQQKIGSVAAEMEEIFPTSRSGITTHSLIVLYTGLG